MISALSQFESDIRHINLSRKKRACLMCDRDFNTTRVSRICGRCHKLIDRNAG
ncbi:MAG: hypothetical protein AB7F75_07570 [Planctomycetota bacterium]